MSSGFDLIGNVSRCVCLLQSATVGGRRTVTNQTPEPSDPISHALTPTYPSISFTVTPHRTPPIHTTSTPSFPRHLQSVKSPSISPPLSLSIQLHLFLCGPPAVTAPSHVCQSQLAHLLLHTNTPRHAHAFCYVHTCQSDIVQERRGEEELVFVSKRLSIFNLKLESEECLSPGVSRSNNWQLDLFTGKGGGGGGVFFLISIPRYRLQLTAACPGCCSCVLKHNEASAQDRQAPFSHRRRFRLWIQRVNGAKRKRRPSPQQDSSRFVQFQLLPVSISTVRIFVCILQTSK